MARDVVLILGPPASGKTTLARELAAARGLEVFDRDDHPGWDEEAFTHAVGAACANPDAQAVVIRTGRSHLARRRAAALCQPTELVVMDTPREVCEQRVLERNPPDLGGQLEAIARWFTTPPRVTSREQSERW